jgi:hypothetical protein
MARERCSTWWSRSPYIPYGELAGWLRGAQRAPGNDERSQPCGPNRSASPARTSGSRQMAPSWVVNTAGPGESNRRRFNSCSQRHHPTPADELPPPILALVSADRTVISRHPNAGVASATHTVAQNSTIRALGEPDPGLGGLIRALAPVIYPKASCSVRGADKCPPVPRGSTVAGRSGIAAPDDP